MTRRQKGETRRIYHPQPSRSIDPTLRIHNRHRIRFLPHLVRGRGMIYGIETQFYYIQYFLVGFNLRARENLRTNDDLSHDRGCKDLACALVRCNGYLLICGMCEPVGVDQRLVSSVG